VAYSGDKCNLFIVFDSPIVLTVVTGTFLLLMKHSIQIYSRRYGISVHSAGCWLTDKQTYSCDMARRDGIYDRWPTDVFIRRPFPKFVTWLLFHCYLYRPCRYCDILHWYYDGTLLTVLIGGYWYSSIFNIGRYGIYSLFLIPDWFCCAAFIYSDVGTVFWLWYSLLAVFLHSFLCLLVTRKSFRSTIPDSGPILFLTVHYSPNSLIHYYLLLIDSIHWFIRYSMIHSTLFWWYGTTEERLLIRPHSTRCCSVPLLSWFIDDSIVDLIHSMGTFLIVTWFFCWLMTIIRLMIRCFVVLLPFIPMNCSGIQ